jgi:hypothetical protein
LTWITPTAAGPRTHRSRSRTHWGPHTRSSRRCASARTSRSIPHTPRARIYEGSTVYAGPVINWIPTRDLWITAGFEWQLTDTVRRAEVPGRPDRRLFLLSIC